METEQLEQTQERMDQQIQSDIAQHGWHVMNVLGGDGWPQWSYSIGAWKSYRHPEIVVFGLPHEHLTAVIRAILERVLAGERFEEGKIYPGLFTSPATCGFAVVDPQWYPPVLGRAYDYYGGGEFPVLQCIWSDAQGLYPWQAGVDEQCARLQPPLWPKPTPTEAPAPPESEPAVSSTTIEPQPAQTEAFTNGAPARGHQIVIREATAADLPRLLDLLHQLSPLSERPEEAPPALAEAHHLALREIQGGQYATCLVLEDNGRLQGTLTLYNLPNLSHGGRPIALVENVVVDGAARGRGYGRLLMDRAEAIARELGCYKVALASNRRRADAHHFYEHVGFSATHEGFTRYFV